MVLRAMFSGVFGLRAEGEAIGVVGDNIANVNTVGFKTQRVIFRDVLGHSILAGTSSGLAGGGVKVGDVQQLFTQGSLANTGISTDLALNGDGFFVVRGTQDGISGNFYTRAGQMHIDDTGNIVNSVDMFVQGYQADSAGVLSATVSDLRVPTASLAAKMTEDVTFTLNLDASTAASGVVFDVTDPGGTADFATSIVVHDSLGAAHALDIYFQKIADNTWDYHALMDGANLNGGVAGVAQEVGNGTLTFETNGALLDGVPAPFTVDFVGGATAAQPIQLDFGDDINTDLTTGLGGTTQFASASAVSSASQDGYTSGDFSGVAVDGQGLVQGLYTNGEKITIGRLTVAKFRNNEGLGRAGNSMFIETRDSGTAAMGAAASGGRAAVSAGALEQSNVDLAEEFVGLIQHQRSFSANSTTITTADEMLQTLISIKR